MPVVDELVSIVRFDVDAGSEAALEGAKQKVDDLEESTKNLEPAAQGAKSATEALSTAMNGAAPNTDKLKTSMDGLEDTGKKLDAVMDGIGKKLAAIGIAGAVAGGLAVARGAWNMTLRYGKEADEMAKLGESLGTTGEQASRWDAAITTSGGNAKKVFADLQKIGIKKPKFGLEEIYEVADKLSSMDLSKARFEGKVMGLGEDAARFLHQGSEGIKEALAKAEQSGHGFLQRHIDDLQKANQRYVQLEKTIDGFRGRLAGELAPAVENALNNINASLVKNQDAWDVWAEEIGAIADRVSLAINGVTGIARTSKEGDEAARSEDAGVRQEEIGRREKDLFWSSMASTAHGLNSAAFYAMAGKPGMAVDALTRIYSRTENLVKPLEEARDIDRRLSEAMTPKIKRTFPDRLAGLDNPTMDEIAAAEMAGSFDNSAAELQRAMIDMSKVRLPMPAAGGDRTGWTNRQPPNFGEGGGAVREANIAVYVYPQSGDPHVIGQTTGSSVQEALKSMYGNDFQDTTR